jgi:hypothetical protein
MCGACDDLRETLQRSLEGVDQVGRWWCNFKELRKIFRRSHTAIDRCVLSVLETKGRDAPALRHLRNEVQDFYDAVAAHVLVPEQHYVFSCISTFLSSIPADGCVDEISTILESFDTFTLAFYAMDQFPNARDRVEWIERYKKLDVGQRRQGLDSKDFHLFFTEGNSFLGTIRSSLRVQPTPLG